MSRNPAGGSPELIASYMTLHGAGWTEPARNAFDDRARAAANAGFTGIGSQLVDVFDHGDGPAEVAVSAARHGLEVLECEFLGAWAHADGGTWPVETQERLDRMTAEVGVRHVTAGEFGDAPLDLGLAAANLSRAASGLAGRGVRIAIEPFAWGSISDYRTALELVRRSKASNVGIMIDVWHYFNTGSTPELLDDVEIGEIAAVQLNDGARVRKNFRDAARTTRCLPGEGELDVDGLIEKLRARGYAGPWSVEVNNPVFRRLPVEIAAEAAYSASRKALDG